MLWQKHNYFLKNKSLLYLLKRVWKFWWFSATLRFYELCKSSQIDLRHFMSFNNFFYNFFYIYKTFKELSAKYYIYNKDKPLKKLVKRIKLFLKRKKKKKPQYGSEQCKNLLEDEKQKLNEYTKKSYKMEKNILL